MSGPVHYDIESIRRQLLEAQEALFQKATANARDPQDLAWLAVQHRLWTASVPSIMAVFEEWNLGTDNQMIAKGVAMIAGNLYGFFAVNADLAARLRLASELPDAIELAMNSRQAEYHHGLEVRPMQGSRA